MTTPESQQPPHQDDATFSWQVDPELAFPADPLAEEHPTIELPVMEPAESNTGTTTDRTTDTLTDDQQEVEARYRYPLAKVDGFLGRVVLQHQIKTGAKTHKSEVSGTRDESGRRYRDAEPQLLGRRVSMESKKLDAKAKEINKKVREHYDDGDEIPEELAAAMATLDAARAARSPQSILTETVEKQKTPLRRETREALKRANARRRIQDAEWAASGRTDALTSAERVPTHLIERSRRARGLETNLPEASPNLGEVLKTSEVSGILRRIYASLEGANAYAVRTGLALDGPEMYSHKDSLIKAAGKTLREYSDGKVDISDPRTVITLRGVLGLSRDQFDELFPAPVRRQRVERGPRTGFDDRTRRPDDDDDDPRTGPRNGNNPRSPRPTSPPTPRPRPTPEPVPVTPEPVSEVTPEPTPEVEPTPLEPSVEVTLDPTPAPEADPVEPDTNPEPEAATPVATEAVADTAEEPDTEFNERELLNLGRIRGLKQRIEKQVEARVAEARQAAFAEKRGFDALKARRDIEQEVNIRLMAEYLDVGVAHLSGVPTSITDKMQDLLDMPWDEYNKLGGGPKPKDGPKSGPRPAPRPQTPPRQNTPRQAPRQDRQNRGRDRSIEQQFGSWRDEIPGM